MNLTEYLIRRPASALALALLLLAVGAASYYFGLPWRGQPADSAGTIVVEIAWPGAESSAVERAIAEPVQRALGGLDGVAAIDAYSRAGAATIEVRLRRHADAQASYNSIQARLNATALPAGSLAPALHERGDSDAVLIAITGPGLDAHRSAEIAAAARPVLGGLPGVGRLRVLGGQDAVIRVAFDPARAIALGVSLDEVERALSRANVANRGGVMRGRWSTLEVQAGAPLTRPQQLAELVVGAHDGQPVTLGDVASVGWGLRQSGAITLLDGKPALILAIDRKIGANALDLSTTLGAAMPQLADTLAPGLSAEILHDAGSDDRAALERDLLILAAAIGAAVLAVWLMLGWWRAGVVPVVSAAVVLAASCLLWWALGGSLNPLALLAAIVGMGLVADDAMTVVEDVDRQLREGKPPMLAPLFAARYLARPTVATALTVAALFTPFALGVETGHGWMRDFALALGLTALVSGIVSMTLAPALCARFMRYRVRPPSLGRVIERLTRALTNGYDKMLVGIMKRRRIMAVLMLALLGALPWLWHGTPIDTAPPVDRSSLRIQAFAPAEADRSYLEFHAGRIDRALAGLDEVRHRLAVIDGDGRPMSIVATLKPSDQRDRSAQTLARELQPALERLLGLSAWVEFAGAGAPLRLTVSAPHGPRVLAQTADSLIGKARESGLFAFIDGAPRLYRPALRLTVDRDKAASLGVPLESIGRSLSILLDGQRVGALDIGGASIPVVLQAKPGLGAAPMALNQFFLRTGGGGMVPLLELVSLRGDVEPAVLLQHDGRNAIVIEAVPAAGVSLTAAAAQLRELARQALPKEFTASLAGEMTRDDINLLLLAAIALLAAYLVLAAVVENFRDPIAILVGSAPALAACLAVPALGLTTLNSFSMMALLCAFAFTLRQGVLLNAIAREFQSRDGHDRAQAVGLAALQRLRPALIGAVTLCGVLLPLALIEGPGQAMRQALAWPLLSGIGVGTLLMLLLTPPAFSLLADNHRAVQMSDSLRATAAPRAPPPAPVPMPIPEAPRPLRPVNPLPKPKPVRRRRKIGGGDAEGVDEEPDAERDTKPNEPSAAG